MKIEILSEQENKPLKRKEIDFRVEHIGATTPSRADIHSKLAAQFNVDASTVVVRKLDTKYGIGITRGTARIYASPEQLKRIELDYVVKRHETKEG